MGALADEGSGRVGGQADEWTGRAHWADERTSWRTSGLADERTGADRRTTDFRRVKLLI